MSTPGGASIPPEQLKARYIGTGHPDMTKQWVLIRDVASFITNFPLLILQNIVYDYCCFRVKFNDSEWITNQHRDTYASHVGHYDQLSSYAVAQNESIARVRLQFLEVRASIIFPCCSDFIVMTYNDTTNQWILFNFLISSIQKIYQPCGP